MTKPHEEFRKHVQNAQLAIVEKALVAFVEDVDGRVPSDEEIMQEGHHVQFEANDLSIFEKDGKRFVGYYVWRFEHVVALSFMDRNPLVLTIVRVAKEDWPPTLRLWIDKKKAELA